MKRKVLTVALVVMLIAIMVSGTMAYFTAQDEVENTFTLGSVEIEIYENGKETTSDTIPFGRLIPIVNTASPGEDVHYIKKVVEVKNTGINSAYIRVHIAIPTALVGYMHLDMHESGWTKQAGSVAFVDGVAYTVYTYDHSAAVASGDFSCELLQGVYLGSNVDVEENADGNLVFVLRDTDSKLTANSGFVAHTKTAGGYTSNTVNVLVAAEAIQERNFENGATDALDTGFGVNTNPWK